MLYNLISKDLNREISNQNKDNEYIDCRDAEKFKASHLKSAINIDIANLKENKENLFKSLKILLDFKNLIIVGENLVSFDNDLVESLFEFFKSLESAKISLNRVYVLNGNISELLNEYPYFNQSQESRMKEKYLPLLLYSEQDRVRKNPSASVRDSPPRDPKNSEGKEFVKNIYIQEYQKFKQSFNEELYYDTLGIRGVYITFKSIGLDDLNIKYTSKEKASQYELCLENNKKVQTFTEDLTNMKEVQSILKALYSKRFPFVVVHESKKAEAAIIQIINFLKMHEKIELNTLQSYIEERIPKIATSQAHTENSKKLEKIEQKKSPKKQMSKEIDSNQEKASKSRLEEFNELMIALKKSCKNNAEAFDEIYNLIGKILDNIIKNPEEEKFRNLNENNAKLKQTIFKYDSSKKIVELLGFRKKEGGTESQNQYYNPLDVSNLKHIKIDIDIAYKNSCNN